MEQDRVRQDLLHWYDAHRRDLPWRRAPHAEDPYAVLVSEVMLQQTRVDVVAPYFDRWLQRWPSVQDLANAGEDEVLAQWSGLGYYRRARNLHTASKWIAAHGWPDELQELPGVGPYVAGALASIGFGRPAVAVDGNVQRVLSRLGNLQEDVTKAVGRRAVHELAKQLLAPERPGDWTQALMELGASVCTPTAPSCPTCPVQTHCQAIEPAALPNKPTKPKPVDETVHFAVVRDGDHVMLVRRPDQGLLGGTWGLPGGLVDTPLKRLVEEQTACQAQISEAHGTATHTFSHRRWTMHVHPAVCTGGTVKDGVRWVRLDALHELGVATAMRKALQAAPVFAPQAH